MHAAGIPSIVGSSKSHAKQSNAACLTESALMKSADESLRTSARRTTTNPVREEIAHWEKEQGPRPL